MHRNVIDLHARRDVLKAHGVPIRRGVLLYGPPGTGKTFACRYVCAQLEGVTKIMVAGTALRADVDPAYIDALLDIPIVLPPLVLGLSQPSSDQSLIVPR